MTELVLRNVEEELVEELKLRAERNGQTPEEEHRQILRRALGTHQSGSSLKKLIEEMPNVGNDEDFERSQDLGRPVVL
jgi:plasmid stability protein